MFKHRRGLFDFFHHQIHCSYTAKINPQPALPYISNFCLISFKFLVKNVVSQSKQVRHHMHKCLQIPSTQNYRFRCGWRRCSMHNALSLWGEGEGQVHGLGKTTPEQRVCTGEMHLCRTAGVWGKMLNDIWRAWALWWHRDIILCTE